MSRKFRVILESNESGGYTVMVPLLPGCISEGDTREEALLNITEAIELYIESLRMDGEPIPTEEDIEEAVVEVTA
jgi:antitoxin HicB